MAERKGFRRSDCGVRTDATRQDEIWVHNRMGSIKRRLLRRGWCVGEVIWHWRPVRDTKRHFAVTVRDGDEKIWVELDPDLAGLDRDHQEAILRHEWGHVVDMLYGADLIGVEDEKPVLCEATDAAWATWESRDHDGVERTADTLAWALFGDPIHYDGPCTLQSLEGGVYPRPRALNPLPELDLAVASDPTTPASVLAGHINAIAVLGDDGWEDLLYGDDEEAVAVIQAIAANPNTPAMTLAQMLEDAPFRFYVYEPIATNPAVQLGFSMGVMPPEFYTALDGRLPGMFLGATDLQMAEMRVDVEAGEELPPRPDLQPFFAKLLVWAERLGPDSIYLGRSAADVVRDMMAEGQAGDISAIMDLLDALDTLWSPGLERSMARLQIASWIYSDIHHEPFPWAGYLPQ